MLLSDINGALLPELILTLTIIVGVILTFVLKPDKQKIIFFISFIGVICSLKSFSFLAPTGQFVFQNGHLIPQNNYFAFNGSFVSNGFTVFFRSLILIGTLITLLISQKHAENFGKTAGEFFVLILTATLGGMLLSGSNDLIMLFIALETLSLSSYALCGYTKSDKLSNEAALKYLIIGGVSSAIMLYGMSFLYGMTAQTNLIQISQALFSIPVNSLLIVSLILTFGGIAFKLAAFPFHTWAPDAYQGAPVPVAAFLSVVSKIAGFAVLIRVLFEIFTKVPFMGIVIASIAAVTMTLGNLMAIKQTNIKRLMAYSSIAQAGYVLAGIALISKLGLSSVMFYLLTYVFMNLGAWTAIEIFSNQTGKDNIQDFGGLAFIRPKLTLGFTLCLLSLAGIPITAGFFSKFYLFKAMAFAGSSYYPLLFITLVNTLIAVYYYLNVVKVMFLKPVQVEIEELVTKQLLSPYLTTTLLFSCIAVILMGIFASPFLTHINNILIEMVGYF